MAIHILGDGWPRVAIHVCYDESCQPLNPVMLQIKKHPLSDDLILVI